MNPKENFPIPENYEQNHNDSQKQHPPFDPIEQKIGGCVALITKEYKAKLWKDLPDDISNLLWKAFVWKTEEERDEICDDLIDIVQNSDNVNNEFEKYFNKHSITQFENSNEQNKHLYLKSENINEQNKTERNAELSEREESFDNLANSLSTLNWEWKNYNSTLTRVKNLKTLVAEKWLNADFEAEVKAILQELNNPEILFAISLDLQQKDPEAYQTFKSSVIELQPSFEAKFTALEPRLKLALGSDTLKNATITGNRISQTSPDGYTTTAELDGADRTFWRADSRYRLKSTLDSEKPLHKEMGRVEKELNRRIEPIIKELQSLEAVKKYLETAAVQNTDLIEIKEEIQRFSPELYAELWLQSLTSLAEIQKALDAQARRLTKEKDKQENTARDYLDILAQRHHYELAEKQKIQKMVLDFLHLIWFDLMPPTAIDGIIAAVNATPHKYWLNQKIDFANGSLWFDADFWDREINEHEKQKFIAFFNKMLTWNSEYPVKMNNGITIFYANQEDARNNIPANGFFSIGQFVNRNLWTDPIYRALQNLEKKENEDTLN